MTDTDATTTQQVQQLVADVCARLEDLMDAYGDPPPPKPHPPATLDDIRKVEQVRQVQLPEDYKAFLLLHNGWPKFSGQEALLSTDELLGGKIFDGLVELQEELLGVEQIAAGRGFIFEASLGTSMSYFDYEGVRETGRIDAVLWSNGEVKRYPSFTDYLRGYRDNLDEMITNERANLR